MAKISINMKAGSVQHDEDTIIGIDLGTTNKMCIRDSHRPWYVNSHLPDYEWL